MAVKTPWDALAMAWAGLVVCYLFTMAVGLLHMRHKPFMTARGARFMAVMCVAGIVHTLAATVSHQHAATLEALEAMSCVVWGYWLPWVAVGVWFTAQYLQIVTYTAMLSRGLTQRGTRRVILSRPVLALVTMAPPVAISLGVTLTPGAVHVDAETGACVSALGSKLLVAGWIGACIVLLATSLLCFRRTLSRDAVHDMPRQWVVLFVSVLVAAAQAYVIVVASRGFEDVANRVLATATIGAMYALAMSVLAARPLWKILLGNTLYFEQHDDELNLVQQPVTSIMELLATTADDPQRALRTIVADFIMYCSDPKHKWMSRGPGRRTHPLGLASMYTTMDAWTLRALGDRYNHATRAYGRRDSAGYPPVFSTDIVRTPQEICDTYFPAPHGRHAGAASSVGPLDLPPEMVNTVMRRIADKDTEADLFRELLWWTLAMLDHFYGHEYLAHDILTRPIYLEDADVRVALVGVLQAEGQRRLAAGGVPTARRVVPLDGDLSDSENSSDVEVVELGGPADADESETDDE